MQPPDGKSEIPIRLSNFHIQNWTLSPTSIHLLTFSFFFFQSSTREVSFRPNSRPRVHRVALLRVTPFDILASCSCIELPGRRGPFVWKSTATRVTARYRFAARVPLYRARDISAARAAHTYRIGCTQKARLEILVFHRHDWRTFKRVCRKDTRFTG